MECGIDLAGFKDVRVGDMIEAFTTEKLAAELGQNTAELKRQQMAELKAAKERENEIAAADAAAADAAAPVSV
jgi:translation initiation factor IF-2